MSLFNKHAKSLYWIVKHVKYFTPTFMGKFMRTILNYIIILRMKPYTGECYDGVDTSTLIGKVMCGYQGWFSAEGDHSDIGWAHYGYGDNRLLKPGHCTFDLWPDMSEMDADEMFSTSFKHNDGTTACLYSSYIDKTVIRHFRWMENYGIDGIFLQRFGVSLKHLREHNHCNVVLSHVQAGANLHGRTWAVMYDLSGLTSGDIEKYVIEDWKRLIDRIKIRQDKAYLHHKGKIVVALWGIGFNDDLLDECDKLVKFVKNDIRYGGNTVMLGVPALWRSLNGDLSRNKKLHNIIIQADIISPWTVGRYNSSEGAENYANFIVKGDIKWAMQHDLDYLPVAFPGFSWQNLSKCQGGSNRLGEIPRMKGQFLWSQVVALKQAGAQMLYVAMFDEVDEGTAILKCTNNPPVGESRFLTYEGLPSDYYLWLTGKAGELLRNKIPVSKNIPARNTQQRDVVMKSMR